MNKTSKNRDLIERYLLGYSPPSEVQSVEEKIQTDPAFSKEVEEIRTMIESIKEKDVMEYRKLVQQVQEKYSRAQNRTGNGGIFTRITPLMAAAVMLFLAVLAFIFVQSQPTDPQELFDQYYQASSLYSVNRDQPESTEWEKAYEKKDFKTCLEEIQKITPTLNSQFYGAICHIELDQPDLAIPFLKAILKFERSEIREEAIWYLGMAFLKKGDSANAKATLQMLIPEDENKAVFKKEEALNIINQLP